MNSCNIIGRLTADPELRRTGDGTPVCSYTLAVKRPGVKDTTDFIDFVTWRQGAEYLCQYGHKGDVVAATAALQTRSWNDKEGNKRKTFEVVTTNVELLSGKKDSQVGGNTNQNQNSFQGKVHQPQQGYNQQGFGGYAPIDIPDAQLPF